MCTLPQDVGSPRKAEPERPPGELAGSVTVVEHDDADMVPRQGADLDVPPWGGKDVRDFRHDAQPRKYYQGIQQ